MFFSAESIQKPGNTLCWTKPIHIQERQEWKFPCCSEGCITLWKTRVMFVSYLPVLHWEMKMLTVKYVILHEGFVQIHHLNHQISSELRESLLILRPIPFQHPMSRLQSWRTVSKHILILSVWIMRMLAKRS